MSEYVYPSEVLPEIKYPKSPVNCCGECCKGIVTNPGAIIPVYRCELIAWLFEQKGD